LRDLEIQRTPHWTREAQLKKWRVYDRLSSPVPTANLSDDKEAQDG
jgi:hypothetical protein